MITTLRQRHEWFCPFAIKVSKNEKLEYCVNWTCSYWSLWQNQALSLQHCCYLQKKILLKNASVCCTTWECPNDNCASNHVVEKVVDAFIIAACPLLGVCLIEMEDVAKRPSDSLGPWESLCLCPRWLPLTRTCSKEGLFEDKRRSTSSDITPQLVWAQGLSWLVCKY